MKATALAVAMAALPLAATSPHVHAAGLGKIVVYSALGQPLRAELEVSANRDEAQSLIAKVASPDAFRAAGIDYAPALVNLHFSRELKERGGRRYIEISSDRPLNEPFVDMLIELSWASGRLVREYTFLLDPPDAPAKTAPAAAAAIAPPETRQPRAAETPPVAETRPVAPRPAVSVTLAPPSPERVPAKAPTSATGRTHTVAVGETLHKVAAATPLEGVSLDQMLVALFRGNREAFDGDNMNRLKAGKILSIPDAETANKATPSQARAEVLAQAADFNAYRKKLAGMAAAAPVSETRPTQAASGKIAPKVEDKMLATPGKDKLEVSRSEPVKDANSKVLQGRVSSLEEDLVSRDRALKDASNRIVELEKNLKELRKLAEIKNQAGAELQQQAQAAKPAAPAASPPVPPAPAAAVTTSSIVAVTETTLAAVTTSTVVPVAAAPIAEPPKPAEAQPPAPRPPAKPVQMPEPEPEEPSFLEANGMILGGAALAALLGGLGFATYRRKRHEAWAAEPIIVETDMSANSVFDSTSIAPPPSEQEASQFSSTGASMANVVETMDPVTEADTFLAFGRDAQAEEILLEARKADPQRLAIHMKLLDIYYGRKSVQAFADVAKQVHELTGGKGSDWDKAAAMGALLDPSNALYGAAGQEEHAATPPP
ncbi:MAG TPA: FimV/HubP family polar landmark protein, partial [Rhodocyclaceae bacterium]|nr:FimV/HubP family polar landmark protein [Rhodocyclaceae bacterium]